MIYIFTLFFYIFSIKLAYSDCKKFYTSNKDYIILFLSILYIGLLGNIFTIINFYIFFVVFIFIIVGLLIFRRTVFGGGDIKYILLATLYLEPIFFPIFLILSGIFQLIMLFYIRVIRKRRVAPMVPVMFFSIFIIDLLIYFEFQIYYINLFS